MSRQKPFSIISHIDYDGLISAFLVTRLFGMPKNIMFTIPDMITEGKIRLTENDIVCDLPNPREKIRLWFDHHRTGLEVNQRYEGRFDPNAKSCARVIFDAYPELKEYKQLVESADKIDSASFTAEDFETPDAAGKISIALATGNRYRDDLFKLWVIELLNRGVTIEEIAEMDVVRDTNRFKQGSIDSIYENLKVEFVTRINTKIGIMQKDGVPKTVIYRLFLEDKDLDYVISYSAYDLDDRFYTVGIGANPFDKKRNKVNLAKMAKDIGGGGGHNDVAGMKIKKADWERIKNTIIVQLSEMSAQ